MRCPFWSSAARPCAHLYGVAGSRVVPTTTIGPLPAAVIFLGALLAGSGPIVVVGTTRDPATPYKWAQGLAAELQNGHLITYNGDGHTAYMRHNSCVDGTVDAYLVKGVVPPPGLRC